eukprot:gb/GFBE01021419.1/.p1 GENE.gb/GFBE01021419.1/~~gb/GFBE01021419.1/.p1  ORF type:complete len:120 (+),score=19.20 gb/GFBE01021419.1/:1-360(+)
MEIVECRLAVKGGAGGRRFRMRHFPKPVPLVMSSLPYHAFTWRNLWGGGFFASFVLVNAAPLLLRQGPCTMEVGKGGVAVEQQGASGIIMMDIELVVMELMDIIDLMDMVMMVLYRCLN